MPRADSPSSCKIGRSDLQLLLRAKLGSRLTVLESSSENLLPPGENFACEMLKVRALIKRDDDSEPEELKLVAKGFAPADAAVRTVFDFAKLFKKEVFFYESLAPKLDELAREFAEEDFQVTPKLCGFRSIDELETKEGVVLLMENLKESGYYMLDKIKGLDLPHARLAIQNLARFHALSIACKHHRPDFFTKHVLEYAKVVPFQEQQNVADIFEILFNMLMKDPRCEKYRERIWKLMNPAKKIEFFTYVAEEPWLSIVHHDFWTNNILYHKDRDGNLDDAKFIDFQNYSYNSPLRDIPYFICSSTSHEVMTKHFDELIDLYYGTFVDMLKKVKVDVEPYRKDKFNEQLKIDASFEFFHSIMAIKFFTAEINKETYDPNQLNQVVIFSEANALAYEKWYHIIQTFIKQGWL